MTTRTLRTSLLVLHTLAFTIGANAASGLIDKWTGDGDPNDSIGAYNGTASNITYIGGHSNQAFAFDGSGSIDFGTNAAVFGAADFTIGMWVQTTSSDPQDVLSKRFNCSGNLFDLQLNTGLATFEIGDTNGSMMTVTSRSRLDDGVFHHLAVMRSSNNLMMFIDGVLSALSTSTNVIDLQNSPELYQTNVYTVYDTNGVAVLDGDGNEVTTTNIDLTSFPATLTAGSGSCAPNFVGALDEIEIYGRTLSPYEIYQMSHPDVGLAILDQPLNQRALAGRPIVFHVFAVGQDPITYQWRLNGYDIPGAISNNLFIDAPQTFDAGTYSILVSNPTGDITSRDATLVVTNLNVSTNGLIDRWSAEGTAKDSIGSHNGAVQNISYTPGVLGTAFAFNGQAAVRCGNIFGTMGTNDFTVDFWMKTTSKHSLGILGQRPYCSWTDCWDIRFIEHPDGSGSIRCELGDHFDLTNPEYNAEQPSTSHTGLHLNDGVFHHVCAVHHANGLSLYVDGKFIETGYSETPTYLENNASFDMGINVCGGEYAPFTGALDEIEIYNRALSDEEVYNTYSPTPALTLIRQPVTASVIEGQSATLVVSAAGQQPITFQWLLNGAPIAGATDPTYALTSAQLADTGTYTVAVSNSISSLTSAGGFLRVIPANTVLPGLVHYWPGEGNSEDIVSHVQAQGGGDVSYAAGVNGQAFSFNGNDQSTSGNSTTANFCTNDFTIHLWINNQNDGTVMAKLGEFAIYCNGGVITANVSDDTGNSCSINSSPAGIGYNAFHQVDLVRQNSTNLLMYIDSALISSNTCTLSNIHSIWGFALCDEYGRNKRFGGLLDEVQIYYRALSTDEVSWLYNRYVTGPRVSTVSIQELTQLVGSSFTLSAPTVTTALPVTYQWMFNGVPIAGAIGSTLTVSNFDPSGEGVYTVSITDANGSVASLVARVSVQLAAGSYNGLFYYDGDVTDDTSGFITLTLTPNQSYSAAIKQQGHTYSFTGKFSAHSSTKQISRASAGKSPLTVTISAAAGGDGKLTGVVRDTTRNIPLVMQRAIYSQNNPTPQQGAYTISLFGLSTPTAPNGHGYGYVTIGKGGAIGFNAILADGWPISQGVGVAKSGVWPLYAPAYRGKGSVLGWLSFNRTNVNSCSGTLRWVKSHSAGGTNYLAGFATKIPVTGSTYTQIPGSLGIGLNNSSMVLDGAKIYSAVNDPIVSTNINKIVFSQTGATNGTLTVTPKYGQFSGKIYNPLTHANEMVKGTVLQNQGYAAGYFMSSGLSGRVVLQHN